MVTKLTEEQWQQVRKLGQQGMRGKAIVDILSLNLHPANVNKFLQKEGIGQIGEPGELTVAEARRQQIEELWYGYQNALPITIKKELDGTRVVVLSDAQIPFEERWLIGGATNKNGAIERFLYDFDPDYLIINGDWADVYSASRYDKRPGRRFNLKDELKAVRSSLAGLTNAAPHATRIFLEGNHEDRLMKTMIQVAQKDIRALELFGASNLDGLTAKNLLALDDTGWKWQPYCGFVNFLGFIITHGDIVGQESAETARKMFQKWHSSGCSGHTHRLGSYYSTEATGKSHVWHETGCLCRLDLEYVRGPNWQQGFLIGTVSDNLLHTQLVPIFNNRFVIPNVGVYRVRE